MIRAAIVGAGHIAEDVHLPVLRSVVGVNVVALCDADPMRAQRLAARYGIPNIYDSFQMLLANQATDFVVIATPPDTHFALAKAALQARLHVLVEKPLALAATEALELVALSRDVNRKLGVLQTYRFRSAFVRMLEQIASGSIGRVREVGFSAHGGDIFSNRRAWTWDQKGTRLLLYELGIHYIDLMIQCAGPIVEITGVAAERRGDSVTAIHALVRHASGAVGSIDVQVESASHSTTFYVLGTTRDLTVTLFPEHIRALRGQITPPTLIRAEVARTAAFIATLIPQMLHRSQDDHHRAPHALVMRQFVRAVAEPEAQPAVTGDSVIPLLDALDRIHGAL